MKKIGFVGYDSPDIVLYLARLRAQDGSKVTVVDMSEDKAFISMIHLATEVPEKDMYKDIHIVTKNLVSEVLDADCVFFYFGYEADELKRSGLTDLVMVTDMVPANARRLRGIEVPEIINNGVFLVRNAVATKFSATVLVKLSEHLIDDEYVCLLPYEEIDYRARCYLCIDTRAPLSKLSDGMQETLYRLYELLFEPVGRKKFKEIMRKA